MADRDDRGKAGDPTGPETPQGAGKPRPLPPVEGQEESLKVHGDKLEKLIPKRD